MLTLYLNCKRVDANGRLINYMSKINLIDLAGSEDNRRTGNQAGSSTFKEKVTANVIKWVALKRAVCDVCLIDSSTSIRLGKSSNSSSDSEIKSGKSL